MQNFNEIHDKYNGNWVDISKHQHLSEQLIEQYFADLDWYLISKYQILSEEFIEKWQLFVFWKQIFEYQELSINFLLKHINRFSITQQARIRDAANEKNNYK